MIEESSFTPAERSEEAVLSSAIYPNPNNGEVVTLELDHSDAKDVNVRVMDAMGKVVFELPINGEAGTIIDLKFQEALPNGVYHVEVTSDLGRAVHRLVVAH